MNNGYKKEQKNLEEEPLTISRLLGFLEDFRDSLEDIHKERVDDKFLKEYEEKIKNNPKYILHEDSKLKKTTHGGIVEKTGEVKHNIEGRTCYNIPLIRAELGEYVNLIDKVIEKENILQKEPKEDSVKPEEEPKIKEKKEETSAVDVKVETYLGEKEEGSTQYDEIDDIPDGKPYTPPPSQKILPLQRHYIKKAKESAKRFKNVLYIAGAFLGGLVLSQVLNYCQVKSIETSLTKKFNSEILLQRSTDNGQRENIDNNKLALTQYKINSERDLPRIIDKRLKEHREEEEESIDKRFSSQKEQISKDLKKLGDDLERKISDLTKKPQEFEEKHKEEHKNYTDSMKNILVETLDKKIKDFEKENRDELKEIREKLGKIDPKINSEQIEAYITERIKDVFGKYIEKQRKEEVARKKPEEEPKGKEKKKPRKKSKLELLEEEFRNLK